MQKYHFMLVWCLIVEILSTGYIGPGVHLTPMSESAILCRCHAAVPLETERLPVRTIPKNVGRHRPEYAWEAMPLRSAWHTLDACERACVLAHGRSGFASSNAGCSFRATIGTVSCRRLSRERLSRGNLRSIAAPFRRSLSQSFTQQISISAFPNISPPVVPRDTNSSTCSNSILARVWLFVLPVPCASVWPDATLEEVLRAIVHLQSMTIRDLRLPRCNHAKSDCRRFFASVDSERDDCEQCFLQRATGEPAATQDLLDCPMRSGVRLHFVRIRV
jgi:hypothetical protein